MSFTDQDLRVNPDHQLILEQCVLQIPFEQLRSNFKATQKQIERDMNTMVAAASELAKNQELDTESTVLRLDDILERIHGLKAKLSALQREENDVIQRTDKRIKLLSHVNDLKSVNTKEYDDWSKTRLDRLIVDYLLRQGMIESAVGLAERSHTKDYVDVDLFVQCRKIEMSLRNQSTTECLQWCSDNRNSLKRTKTSLEFELRLQEYIELVRKSDIPNALKYAKKYFATYADSQMEQIQKAAVLMAFPPNTEIPKYKQLYSADRWQMLAEHFIAAHHNIYSLPPLPMMHIALSAGLSALKTPSCYSSIPASTTSMIYSPSQVCPVCDPRLNNLARSVPFAHAVRSSLIDSITGSKLTGTNESVVLPNGRVYGQQSLSEWNNYIGTREDYYRDPGTGEEFEIKSLRRVYVL